MRTPASASPITGPTFNQVPTSDVGEGTDLGSVPGCSEPTTRRRPIYWNDLSGAREKRAAEVDGGLDLSSIGPPRDGSRPEVARDGAGAAP